MDLTIPLDDDLSAFVEGQVANGQYASSHDVVREALELLRSLDAGRAFGTDELRHAWRVGVDSGDSGEIDFDALKTEARDRSVR